MSLPPSVVAVALDEVDDRWEAALSEQERLVYRGLSLEKRRRDWLGGRVAAKRAAQRQMALPFPRLEVRAKTEGEDRGRPELYVDGILAGGFLSITHSHGLALATYGDTPVGLDLERVEARDHSFLELVFTEPERARLEALPAEHRDQAITAAWCRKEAYAKLLGLGLRADFELLGAAEALSFVQGTLQFGDATLCWALVEGKEAA